MTLRILRCKKALRIPVRTVLATGTAVMRTIFTCFAHKFYLFYFYVYVFASAEKAHSISSPTGQWSEPVTSV